MSNSIIAAIAYGLLVIIGGIIGYVQARSKMSLIAGIVNGVLLLLASIVQLQGASWGKWLAVIVTIELIIVFISRFIKTRKFMPAGLMVLAGAIALIFMLI